MTNTLNQLIAIRKNIHWLQGVFIDSKQYSRMSDSWKKEQNEREKHLVRPSPEGNSICYATSPEDAQWIVHQLNKLNSLMQENEKQRKELRIKTEFLHNFVKVCKSGNVIATSTNAQKQLSDMFKQYTDDIEALEQLKQPACDNLSNDSDREVME